MQFDLDIRFAPSNLKKAYYSITPTGLTLGLFLVYTGYSVPITVTL